MWHYNVTDTELHEFVQRLLSHEPVGPASSVHPAYLWLRRLSGSFHCEHTPPCSVKGSHMRLLYPDYQEPNYTEPE
jgi:hypothetical protein